MQTPWVESWFKVREQLEKLAKNNLKWIEYKEFKKICKEEGLDKKETDILDEYLHDLGVIIHFKDRLELQNMVILNPEWATDAVYKVLDFQSVRDREGILLHNELEKIWDMIIYPSEIYPNLLKLMNRFEFAYELPDQKSNLVAELLPSTEPDFEWDDTDNLRFYYRYEFLPAGVITRFIVLVHQDLEFKEDGKHLCWREGAVLQRDNTRAFVKVRKIERLIEIKIDGKKKRELLAIIRREFDHINKSIKKIKINEEIPCNCYKDCTNKFDYQQLLNAEKIGKVTVDCPKTWKAVSLSLLLDGYETKEKRVEKYLSDERIKIDFKPHIEVKPIIEVVTNINTAINTYLPSLQNDFKELKNLIVESNPKCEKKLNKIGNSLNKVNSNSKMKKVKKTVNSLREFLRELNDKDSDYYKIISKTEKGIKLTQKIFETYNKLAPWIPGLLILQRLLV